MVDYPSKAQILFRKHFPKFGSAIVEGIYTFKVQIDYDPSTSIITTPTQDNQPLSVIFDKFEEGKIDNKTVLQIDKIAIFPYLNINNNRMLTSGDKFTEGTTDWVVQKVDLDPFKMAYNLHVRPRLAT